VLAAICSTMHTCSRDKARKSQQLEKRAKAIQTNNTRDNLLDQTVDVRALRREG